MISAPRCFGMVFHRSDLWDFFLLETEPLTPPHPGKQRSALATWRRLTRALWAPGKIYSGTSLIQSSQVSGFWGPVSRACRTASAPSAMNHALLGYMQFLLSEAWHAPVGTRNRTRHSCQPVRPRRCKRDFPRLGTIRPSRWRPGLGFRRPERL